VTPPWLWNAQAEKKSGTEHAIKCYSDGEQCARLRLIEFKVFVICDQIALG
jgi:hypothetical protein